MLWIQLHASNIITYVDQTQPHDSNTFHDTANATDQAAENNKKRKLRSPVWAHYELKKKLKKP